MAVGHIFNEYSVICIFGSVVGCVVVPLIAQSMESLILSAIVVTLTAKTLSRHVLSFGSDPQPKEQIQWRVKEREKEKDEKKVKRKKPLQQSTMPSDRERRRREQELLREEEQREAEKERRQEEKREKKARKREERLRRREEERKEKEREEQLYLQQQEKRVLKKRKEKEAKRLLQQELYGQYTHSSTVDWSHLDTVHVRAVRRERKHSTSSSASSSSSPSTRHSLPPHPRHTSRASSDPQLLSPSHSSSPSPSQHTRAWQTTPPPSLDHSWQHWSPSASSASQQQAIQRVTSHSAPPPHPSGCLATASPSLIQPPHPAPSLPVWAGSGPYWNGHATAAIRPEAVQSRQSYEALEQTTWVPGPPSDPTPIRNVGVSSTRSQGLSIFDCLDFGSENGYYSLFSGSGGHMTFAPLPSSNDAPLPPVGHTSAVTMATTSSPAGDVRKEDGFDEWPLL